LTIGVGLICFQNTSGIDAVLFYSETIFTKAGSSIDSAVATIIIGAVMLLSSCITPFFVDSTGRKGLLLTSAMGMTVSLTTMGIYFFFDERDRMHDFGWIPVTALVAFILFYCVGFGPLPFTVLSEMFAPEIKSMASSIAISACWTVDFAVTKAFLPLETVIGSYGNFWLFGFFCVIAFVFTATMVFETKGLSLNEIQDRLNGRKSDVR
jgi:Sugar (and other) transporter